MGFAFDYRPCFVPLKRRKTGVTHRQLYADLELAAPACDGQLRIPTSHDLRPVRTGPGRKVAPAECRRCGRVVWVDCVPDPTGPVAIVREETMTEAIERTGGGHAA